MKKSDLFLYDVTYNNLWEKIQDFEIDDPHSDFTFTMRLEAENNWDIEYSLRVIEEYKKFMFLACIVSHSVCPSDEIDQVWHLHLLYTQSYWKEFCQLVLEKEIHHGPTKGGGEEKSKYEDLYEQTLTSYLEVFSEKPPKDIWPSKEERFKSKIFQRINKKEFWVIKKPI